MIQPVSAFSPRAGFRGHGVKSEYKTPQERSRAQVALINATGTSILAGAITTAVARSYTSSWAHAFILGICGMGLSMFFITPALVERTSLLGSKKKSKISAAATDSTKASSAIKSSLKPTKKLVQFKQS